MSITTYKDAGVDIKKADNILNRVKRTISSTFNPYVLNTIGGFAAVTEIPKGYENPLLVSSTDGVGTKLKIAFSADKHNTIGIDLVAMSANDVLTMGAKPWFFLDYFATGHIEERVYEQVIVGICEGCRLADCALIGGETAEMPGLYEEGEYDLAGFVMGFVERDKVINGSTIKEGDAVIGLRSDGLHSNGFSLVRKVLFEVHTLNVHGAVDEFGGRPLYEELLRPTKIYVKPVMSILDRFVIKGMAHITGGGLQGNVARIIPEGLGATLNLSKQGIPPVFPFIQRLGNVPDNEMYSTFNMGIGFVLVVEKDVADVVIDELAKLGETALPLGYIEKTSRPEIVSVVLNS